MNILSMKKKDYLQKNTILMIIYGLAANLGGIAQLFQDRPKNLALSLIIPSLIVLLIYFAQRKVSMLQSVFPYLVILSALVTVLGCIFSYQVTLSTIVLSFFILVLSSIHNNIQIVISGYILSMVALISNVIRDK